MKYLKKFQTESELNTFNSSSEFIRPNLCAVVERVGVAGAKPIIFTPKPRIITFIVNNVEYQAEEGMSWEKWCNSEYNIDEFWCNENNIRINYGSMIQGQTPSDVICDGCTYTLVNYLTILALEDGLTASLSVNACQYCVDGDNNWIDLPAGTTTQTINQGQTLSFKGNLTPNSSNGIGTFTISKKCNLEGNCMSMLFGDDAVNNYSLDGKSCAFYNLFRDCTNIIEVSASFLPATTLSDYCYSSMFFYCRNLTTAPELPATTLVQGCYESMFKGCSSLTTAPELPATILSENCYQYMFQDCTSLTTAPSILPATRVNQGCYYSMFNGCTSLTTAPSILPATTLADSCYNQMFSGCTSLTTGPELPATTLASTCYQNMFKGCTSLTTAPELPATTLAYNCYNQMFRDCSSLNYIKMLATDKSANGCLWNWVSGVSSTGTFVKYTNMTSLSTGTSGIPSGWTVVDVINTDNYLTILALEDGLTASFSGKACQYCVDGDNNWIDLPAGTATQAINQGQTLSFKGNLIPISYSGIGTFTINKQCNLEGNCMSILFGDDAANNYSLSGKDYAFYRLFRNCTTIIEVSESFLPATTLVHSCYEQMFSGCTSLTTAPELPATTLAQTCYSSMFKGCTSLTTGPELPATTLAKNCYYLMFNGCSNLNYIKMFATDISASNCLGNWVSGVSNTGTFVKNANMTSLPTGDSGIPSGWTVVDVITFTVDGVECQAEEGMTFYDWAMSDYYDDSCRLSVISAMGYYLRDGIIEGNVSPGDAISIVSGGGFSITPDINTDTIIQPISYMTNSGGFPD